MASLGHVAVGLWAARVGAGKRRFPGLASMVGWSLWSLLPDADVVAFVFRIPYAHPWGHRGASHSVVFAAGMALLLGGVAAMLGRRDAVKLGLLAWAVMASHGLLDAMTTGGLGAALGWPFSDARVFLPWRPIPVAPIGRGFLSGAGMEVAATELLMFLPLWAFALWPRAQTAPAAAPSEPTSTAAPE